ARRGGWLGWTTAPRGAPPASSGRHVQNKSFGAVARWMATSTVSPSPSHEIPRVVSLTPPPAKMSRAHQNSATYALPSASAHAVAFGSRDSGCDAGACDTVSRRTADTTSIACGDSLAHSHAGSG